MKIGVLTLPLKGNYGGVLQAYALITFLKQKGHDVYLIDRQWDSRAKKTPMYLIQKFVFHNIIRRNVMRFCDEWINPKTRKIDSQLEMAKLNNDEFGAIIVGSDQVWRVEHTGGVKNNYFLDFVKIPNVKKISYAASFGKDSVDGDKNKLLEIKSLLKSFNSISVREDSGVSICKEVFDVDATHVLDPVLLVDKDVFNPIIDRKLKSKLSNTLTAYVLDDRPEKIKIITDVSNQLNLNVRSVNYKKDPALLLKNKAIDLHNYIYPPVENWLQGFRDAEFVVTDSFHGMMFSIAFNKQFIVIGNERRGLARFTSFLKEFGLLERLVTSENPFRISMISNRIDYTTVNSRIEEWRSKSRDFLNKSLHC